MKRLIAGSLAIASLAAGLVVAETVSAEATGSYMLVCNSAVSKGPIRPYRRDLGYWDSTARTLWQDECQVMYNGVDLVRVDTDASLSSNIIGSYRIGHIDYGYGPCHPGGISNSNPMDAYSDTGVRYKNYGPESNETCQ